MKTELRRVMVNSSRFKGEFNENDIHGAGEYSWADGR
jgi:hypothetical protein